MTDKFVVSTNDVGEIIVTDAETGKVYRYDNIHNFFGLIRLMNEQQTTIDCLRQKKIKETKFVLDEKGIVEKISNKSYPRIKSDEKDNPVATLSCSNLFELVDLLNEQQATIQSLKEENEQLKQQLLYEGDDVCSICKHEYLTPSGNYFIGKCEKGHEECSKEDIEYCEDFKLKELEDE